jgi:hypothetical protein
VRHFNYGQHWKRLLVAATIVVIGASAYAQMRPSTIALSGLFTNAAGKIVANGSYAVRVLGVDQQTGEKTFSEDFESVPVNNGVYNLPIQLDSFATTGSGYLQICRSSLPISSSTNVDIEGCRQPVADQQMYTFAECAQTMDISSTGGMSGMWGQRKLSLAGGCAQPTGKAMELLASSNTNYPSVSAALTTNSSVLPNELPTANTIANGASGPQGLQGDQGTPGDTGPAGATSTIGDSSSTAQTLSFDSGLDILSLSAGNSVDLSSLHDGSDTLASLDCTSGQVAEWNGSGWVCTTPTDNQALTLNNNILSLARGGSVNLSAYVNTDTLAGLNCSSTQIIQFLSGAWQCANETVNTDNQALSLNTTSNVLSLVSGGSVSLSQYVNTDNQQLSLNNGTNVLTLSNGTGANTTVDLSPYNSTYTAGSGLSLISKQLALDPTNLSSTSSVAGSDLIIIGTTSGPESITYNDLFGNVLGALHYQGVWNATTNSPSLTGVCASGTKGQYYVVNTAGTTSLDGATPWNVGDWVVCNGTAWQRVQTSNGVSSVFGRTGSITAQSGDYSASQITNTPDSGSITATNVQAALNQLDQNKLSSILSDGQVFIGNSLGSATAQTVSGDATLNDSGVLTIASGAITGAKLANGAITFAKLASNSCTNGQIIQYSSGSSSWICGPAPATGTVTGITAGNGITTGGANPITSSGTLSISASTCSSANSQLQWTGTAFACGTDQQTTYTAGTGIDIAGTVISSTVVNTDTLATLSCTNNQITQFLSGSWQCANETVNTDGQALSFNTGTNVLSLVNGGSVNLSQYVTSGGNGITESSGQISINSPTCSGTDKLQWSGTAFVCATDQNTTYTAGSGLSLSGTSFINNGILSVTGTSGQISVSAGQNPTLSLVNTGTTGTYGSSTSIPVITTDAQGRVTSVTSTSIPTANTTTSGLLTSTDWNTFNSKQTSVLSDGKILIGNSSNQATAQTISGDASLSDSGVITISSGAVTSAKIASGTILGSNIAAGTVTLANLGQNSCTTNQIIQYSGSAWICANLPTPTNNAWLQTNGSAPTGVTNNIYTSGMVGIGTNNPHVSLEVNSGTSGQSGVRLTQLNSLSTTSAGAPLGVDSSGNLVVLSSSSNANVPTGSILDDTLTDPSTITVAGRYIVPASGNSGVFVGEANQYASYNGSSWTFTAPNTNDKVLITTGSNAGNIYVYNGSVWTQYGSTAGSTTNNAVLELVETGTASGVSVAANGNYIFNSVRYNNSSNISANTSTGVITLMPGVYEVTSSTSGNAAGTTADTATRSLYINGTQDATSGAGAGTDMDHIITLYSTSTLTMEAGTSNTLYPQTAAAQNNLVIKQLSSVVATINSLSSGGTTTGAYNGGTSNVTFTIPATSSSSYSGNLLYTPTVSVASPSGATGATISNISTPFYNAGNNTVTFTANVAANDTSLTTPNAETLAYNVSIGSYSTTTTGQLVTDAITLALSTNLSAYNSASVGAVVPITASEYAAVEAQVANAGQYGWSDSAASAFTTTYTTAIMVSTVAGGSNTTISNLPANNYLVAFKYIAGPVTATQVPVGIIGTQTTGSSSATYSLLASTTAPTAVAGETHYFVIKRPSAVVSSSATQLGLRSGSSTISGNTSYGMPSPSPTTYYSTTLTGSPPYSVSGNWSTDDLYYQAIGTPTKQW